MSSAAVRHVWMPPKRMMPLPLLPLLLPLKQKDLFSDSKKGIKRDASLFMVLKDPKQWNSWHHSTVVQA